MKRIIMALVSFSLCSAALATIPASSLTDLTSKINKAFANKIDQKNHTQFLNASFDTTTLYFHYQMLDRQYKDIDVNAVSGNIRKGLAAGVCKDDISKRLFANHMNISFNYTDKNGFPVTNIVFKPSDCAK